MKAKEYQIRISGSGTRSEIVQSLNRILGNLMFKGSPNEDELEDVIFEDSTLLADINLIENENI